MFVGISDHVFPVQVSAGRINWSGSVLSSSFFNACGSFLSRERCNYLVFKCLCAPFNQIKKFLFLKNDHWCCLNLLHEQSTDVFAIMHGNKWLFTRGKNGSFGCRVFWTSSFQFDNESAFIVGIHNSSWLVKLRDKIEISGQWSVFSCLETEEMGSCLLSLQLLTFNTPLSFLGDPSFWAE